VASRMPSSPPVLSGYSHIRPLGTGGFADVFLFEQNMPRRSVAVKVLLQDVVDSNVLRMFNAEADVMARLSSHPSILTVYTASISADGRPYLVMEFCPSSPAGRYRREPLSVPDVLSLGVKIASALETAHRSGVLHRDIKPSNILTTSFGTPVLADFGIATSLKQSTEELFAMSVPWSAPEVIEEETTGTVQSEVWGFGATLYSLLAGRSPFELADSARASRDQLRQRIVRARFTPIDRADIPASLSAILAQTMTRDPALRQRSMLEVAQQLQAVQAELGIAPTPLEVAVDEWAAAAGPVDFENTVVRGPVISEVAIDSPRRRAKRPRTAARSLTGEGTVFGDSPSPARGGATTGRILLVAGSVALLSAVAVGVLLVVGAL
jgi:serine/threonine protein kinase